MITQFFTVILIIIRFQPAHSQFTACHDGYSCTSTLISSNNSHIECWGYWSCAESIIIEINNYEIQCYGSFSCYKSNLIQHYGTTSNTIFCVFSNTSLIILELFTTVMCGLFVCFSYIIGTALYSCAFVTQIYNNNAKITC